MENLIEVKNLSKRLSKKFSIDNVSFEIKNGFVTGLIGGNGAGKTTLIKLLMGLNIKDSGDITYFNGIKPDEARKKIGYVSDNPAYLGNVRLWDNARLIKKFYSNWDDEIFNKCMARFELDEQKKFQDLSKGMKIKFALVMALSHNPDLLILDEPTAGIDPIFRREMLDILYDFVSQCDKAVLMSTHITSDLDKIADYILFMDKGKIIVDDEKDKILSNYYMIRGYKNDFSDDIKSISDGFCYEMDTFSALIKREKYVDLPNEKYTKNIPSLEDFMFLYNKKNIF